MVFFSALPEDFQKAVLNSNVFIGIIVAAVVFILEIMCLRSFRKSKSCVAKAISLGHVVEATRIKTWNDDMAGSSADSWICSIYAYEVNGKSYQYKYTDRSTGPMTMKLYYLNNPNRPFTGREYNGPLSILFYLLPLAAAIIVINLLNGM